MPKKQNNPIEIKVVEDPFKWDVEKDGGAEELVRQIVEELRKDLPPKNKLRGILDQKDISDWIDSKLVLLKLLDNVVVIMGGNATPHNRQEIARWVSATREVIRAAELKALKFIRWKKSGLLIEFAEHLYEAENPKWSAVI